VIWLALGAGLLAFLVWLGRTSERNRGNGGWRVGGGVLALAGLLRGSMSGLVVAALGGSLLYRGMTGHCCLYQAMGYSTAEPQDPTTETVYRRS